MRLFRTMRARLTLFTGGLIGLGMVTLFALASGQISSVNEAALAREAESSVELLARNVEEPLEHYVEGEGSVAAIQLWVDQLAREVGPIVALDAEGQVLASWRDEDDSSRYADAPEILAAQAGETSSSLRRDESGETYLYAAAPVMHEGTLLGIVQYQRPATDRRAETIHRVAILGGGTLVAAALIAGINLWVAGLLTRPLARLRDAALALASGDLSRRVAVERQDEVGQVGDAFNTMADRLQAMIEEQRAFIANASHELRSPLAAIKVRSEALRDDRLDDTTRAQYVADIDQEAIRMAGLVGDLLLLARIDAGKTQTGGEGVDVRRLARLIGDSFGERADNQGIALEIALAESLPAIHASEGHIRAVIANLLDNAFKYTPEGGAVRLDIGSERESLIIRVRDDGQGIAAEDLPRVTERFYQADKARSRDVPGSGLGLSIVQAIADYYGGTLTIESDGPGTGAQVTVTLPVVINRALTR